MPPPDLFQSWLNHVLRATDNENVGQTIITPVQKGALERDHFIEIQHFVQFIWLDHPNDWQNLAFGHYMDLASFVSDERNVFRVEKAANQGKKSIALANYKTDQGIQTYLGYTIAARNGGTVRASLQSLVRDMRNRNSAYPDLTRACGNRIAAAMGWP